eukprot:GCRY01001922.1.p1 GENE.GCRY01001922.1~~GCRY01001922.1.p1  ORF type:complete len:876 (+),score=240.06 GCRY01001922.1:181-2628(+)
MSQKLQFDASYPDDMADLSEEDSVGEKLPSDLETDDELSIQKEENALVSDYFKKHYEPLSEKLQEMFKLALRLQDTMTRFDMKLDNIPVIVVVGRQSTGKSSLVDAFVGFKFNHCSMSVGTRRPLVLRLLNNPKFDSPQCWLGEENEKIEPENIANRLSALNHIDGFSDKPILLKIEHSRLCNLIIVDTPGWRSKEPELDALIKKEMAPKNRLILCLEDSCMSWKFFFDSMGRLVNSVDPGFQRTVFCGTKFSSVVEKILAKNGNVDDVISQLSSFVSGKMPDGRPTGIEARPRFFVDLVPNRDVVSEDAELRRKVEAQDFSARNMAFGLELATVAEDLPKFVQQVDRTCQPSGEYLGFVKLKKYLENWLMEEIKRTILSMRDSMTVELEHTTKLLDSKTKVCRILKDMDFRSTLAVKLADIAEIIEKLYTRRAVPFEVLQAANLLPQSLEEEVRAAIDDAGTASLLESPWLRDEHLPWTGWGLPVEIAPMLPPPYEGANVMGETQLRRLLDEFEIALRAQEVYHITDEDIKFFTRFRAGKIKDVDLTGKVIVQDKAMSLIKPMAHAACQRAAYILNRLYAQAIACCLEGAKHVPLNTAIDEYDDDLLGGSSLGSVDNAVLSEVDLKEFSRQVQAHVRGVIFSRARRCQQTLERILAAMTDVIADDHTSLCEVTGSLPEDYDPAAPTRAMTKARITREVVESRRSAAMINHESSEDFCREVRIYCIKVFSSIRQHIQTAWRLKLLAAFKGDLVDEATAVLNSFRPRECSDALREEVFRVDAEALQREVDRLARMRQGYREALDTVMEAEKRIRLG